MSNRESSVEMAHLASVIMQTPAKPTGTNAQYNELLARAKSLAGSVLSQREIETAHDNSGEVFDLARDIKRSTVATLKGRDADWLAMSAKRIANTLIRFGEPEAPGTSAFDLIHAFTVADAENTSTLIGMIAATVLVKLGEEEGKGRSNITFSPADVDDVYKRYAVDVAIEGADTTVKVRPLDAGEAGLSLMVRDDVDSTDAKPQALPKDERPVWAVRINGKLQEADDRRTAEGMLSMTGDPLAAIENRMCMHEDCPTTRCNHVPPEVTS